MPTPAPINPYQSPASIADAAPPQSALRRRARRAIVIALALLWPPAMANWACIYFLPGRPLAGSLFAWWDLIWINGTFLATAAWGLSVLELAAGFFGRRLAAGIPRSAWLDAMYGPLLVLPRAAAVGVTLYFFWLALFFFSPLEGSYEVSFILGALGHVLGAWVYVPILFAWWQLRRAALRADENVELQNHSTRERHP